MLSIVCEKRALAQDNKNINNICRQTQWEAPQWEDEGRPPDKDDASVVSQTSADETKVGIVTLSFVHFLTVYTCFVYSLLRNGV